LIDAIAVRQDLESVRVHSVNFVACKMLAAQVCMLERLVHVLGRNQKSAISQVLSHLASSCDVSANAPPATIHVATMVSQAKLERRERRVSSDVRYSSCVVWLEHNSVIELCEMSPLAFDRCRKV
jgi:hypothetical protein